MSSATGAVMPPADDKDEEDGVVFTRAIAVSAPLPPSATTSSSLLGTNCIPPNACVVATCTPTAGPTNATIVTSLWPEPVARATVPVSLAAAPKTEAAEAKVRLRVDGDVGNPDITEAMLAPSALFPVTTA